MKVKIKTDNQIMKIKFLFEKAWLSFLILSIGIMLTLIIANNTKKNLEATKKQEFKLVCNEISSKITTRLHSHAQLLQSAASFFEASNMVTRNDWKMFIKTSGIAENLSGIEGVGYLPIIKKDQLQKHIQQVRKEGFPNYTVWPAGKREFYTPIIYLEPLTDRNFRVLGFDIYTEPTRRKALEQARDNDLTALTGKVLLVQKTDKNGEAGTIMYVPVYRRDMPLNTIKERRAAIVGWISCPYRMNDLMQGILGARGLNDSYKIHLQIYDNDSINERSILYDSQPKDSILQKDQSFQQITLPIVFNGNKWTLQFTKPEGQTINYQSRVFIVLISGLIISLLLFGLSFSILFTLTNAEEIAEHLTSELKESESNFKQLFNSNPDTILIIKLGENKIVEVNTNFLTRSGFSYDEALGKTPTEINIWANKADKDLIFNEIIRKGYIKNFETELLDKAGKLYTVIISANIFNFSGVPHIVSVVRDITERKQTEIALLHEHQRLESIIKGTNVATWEWNVQTGETIFNERWAEIIGYTLEEISPVSIDTWRKFTQPDDLKLCESLHEKHFSGKLDYYKIESRMRHKNGNWVWVQNSGKVTSWTDDGKPLMMFGTHTDINERKLVEEEIKDSREQLRKLASHLQNAREVERKSITLEIHDTLAQYLVALKMDMGIFLKNIAKANVTYNPEELTTEIGKYIEQTDHAIKTARNIMNGLRPEQLELLGFVEATEVYLHDYEEAHHISCQLENKLSGYTIPPEYTLTLFRILQESLNNILKHAMATLVTVQLSTIADQLLLEIVDNGVGFDKNNSGRPDSFGLISMKEQVTLLQGSFDISSSKGEGTKVKVELPIIINNY